MGAGRPEPDLRHRALWLAIGYVLVLATVWGSLVPTPPDWPFLLGDKPLHAATYGLLTFWFGQLYRGWRWHLALLLLFSAFGVLLEIAQAWWSIYRHFDMVDAAAGSAGAACGLVLQRTPAGRWLVWVEERIAAGRS